MKTITYNSYEEYPVYEGTDLGLQYTKEGSTFKLWAPAAEAARVRLYEKDLGGEALQSQDMKRGEKGVWTLEIPEDLQGKYYAFQTKNKGQWSDEVPDPYVKAVGANGKRGAIIDWSTTNPPNWEGDQRPPLAHPTDIVLYELHIRDLSTHSSSGIQHKGKFLGLAETGTKSPEGAATGLDHIKELGVTHVHLLPSFDYMSIDETRPEDNGFNWGYDPQNYNCPEGSYSTNPSDGATRVREFKQMVKSLHDNGLRVILDVVYNHTGATEGSNFNQLVPGYYYRQKEDGSFSDASACGNETASDRPMMRKFIVESVQYWVNEYHLDGFRFDLMGIHDIETMNQVSSALKAIDPSIFVYGEGWTAGSSPLAEEQQALKKNTHRLDRIAAFSDDLRDGAKGSVFEHEDRGFATAKKGMEESIKFGVVA
ncbi:MAG: type I pullulanase, partial [Bacteroidota bacterium]